MRRLIVSMNITLDGYLSGPDGELDWHFKCWTKDMGDTLCSQLAKADTLLLGAVTYRAMAEFWSSQSGGPSSGGDDFAFANMMNYYTKIVFSKTIKGGLWRNTVLYKGPIRPLISKIKKQPGIDIIVLGSGRLVHELIKLDLIDEYRLWVHPVILGKGKPLFKNVRHKRLLTLVNMEIFTSGVAMIQYQPALAIHRNNELSKSQKR